MFLLHLTSYFAALVAFLFVTLSLASGLLYIAEAIEENSSLAKTIGKRLIYGIISLQILLCVFDGIPVSLTLLGIICHIVYLSNFSSNWPFISLTSPKFILSIVLVILDHFAYFFFFAEQSKNPAAWRNPSQRVPYRPSWEDRKAARNSGFGFGQGPPGIMEIATFFGVCVWLVPFYLFLSLSANDNVLPSNGESLSGNMSLGL
ncbi:DUF396-domain-containing protein [Atractiella rhizophila]|nr:DUF396-domain-containing protein [Atractiella rhizophila]KAH8926713.1 DUF396-domain-containing protein [Atractiella rhizophila]